MNINITTVRTFISCLTVFLIIYMIAYSIKGRHQKTSDYATAILDCVKYFFMIIFIAICIHFIKEISASDANDPSYIVYLSFFILGDLIYLIRDFYKKFDFNIPFLKTKPVKLSKTKPQERKKNKPKEISKISIIINGIIALAIITFASKILSGALTGNMFYLILGNQLVFLIAALCITYSTIFVYLTFTNIIGHSTETINKKIYYPIIIITVGITFTITNFVEYISYYDFQETEAKHIGTSQNENITIKNLYQSTYEYTVDNQKYMIRDVYNEKDDGKSKIVKYNPTNPKEAYIKVSYLKPLTIIGIILIVIGLLTSLIIYQKSKRTKGGKLCKQS